MSTKIQYAALGAGSIVVALAMAATAGATGLDDVLYASGTDAASRNSTVVTKDLSVGYEVHPDGNVIKFPGIRSTGQMYPLIDFGTGGTKITSEAGQQLTLKADSLINLNPATAVQIGGGRKISFDGNGGSIELFSAGGLNVAQIIGHNDGNITIKTHKGVLLSPRDGVTVGSSDQLGTVGNGTVTNTLNLGASKDENVAITRTFIASVNLTPGQVVVLDTSNTANDHTNRVTTTTTLNDVHTIGVVVNDNPVDAGSPVKVAVAGVARVIIDGAVTLGDELGSSSTTAGRAITSAAAPTGTAAKLGTALENGSNTGKVAVLINIR